VRTRLDFGFAPLAQFPRKWLPVERKKLRQSKILEPSIRFNRIGKDSSVAMQKFAPQLWRALSEFLDQKLHGDT